MAKGSSKKPGDPKCRACGGLLEGRPAARIGGNHWHRECAEKAGKFIPVEHREGFVKKAKPVEAAAEAETAEEQAPALEGEAQAEEEETVAE